MTANSKSNFKWIVCAQMAFLRIKKRLKISWHSRFNSSTTTWRDGNGRRLLTMLNILRLVGIFAEYRTAMLYTVRQKIGKFSQLLLLWKVKVILVLKKVFFISFYKIKVYISVFPCRDPTRGALVTTFEEKVQNMTLKCIFSNDFVTFDVIPQKEGRRNFLTVLTTKSSWGTRHF
jgi:hypothetical protein